MEFFDSYINVCIDYIIFTGLKEDFTEIRGVAAVEISLFLFDKNALNGPYHLLSEALGYLIAQFDESPVSFLLDSGVYLILKVGSLCEGTL